MKLEVIQGNQRQDFQEHHRLDLLGVKVSDVSVPKAVAMIGQWIASHQKVYVCVAPVSTLVDCQKDANYRRVVNAADMVTPDGMPVVWLGKAAGSKTIERTYGPDLLLAVCHDGQERGYRHFFYGGDLKTLDLLEGKLKLLSPKLNVVGKISPDFKPKATLEDPKTIDMINQSRPDVLWVGLGSPKQDFWIDIHRALLDVPVIVGVGAAFDFLSGVKPQAPIWMRKRGLEWLFRLCSEPRRLWKRYLFGNSAFIFYVCRSFFVKSNNTNQS